MSDVSGPKAAREWVRANAKACPCCGAAVLIQIDGDESMREFMQELAQRGATIAIESAEEVEAYLASREGFERIGSAAGGKTP